MLHHVLPVLLCEGLVGHDVFIKSEPRFSHQHVPDDPGRDSYQSNSTVHPVAAAAP